MSVSTIWWIIGAVGVALQGPMCVAAVQTGRDRLFPRASIRFEHWLINQWNLFLSMFALGAVAWVAGSSQTGLPVWMYVIVGLVDGWIIASAWNGQQKAQDHLNFRLANQSGEFYCRRCDEVHKFGDVHV